MRTPDAALLGIALIGFFLLAKAGEATSEPEAPPRPPPPPPPPIPKGNP